MAAELKAKVLAKRGMSKGNEEPSAEQSADAEEVPAPKGRRAKVKEEA